MSRRAEEQKIQRQFHLLPWWLGNCVLAPLTFGLAAFTGGCAQTSDPAIGAAAQPRRIEQGFFAPINGVDQWITVRGDDIGNPVILMLHGGPGFAQSQLAPAFADWEKDFTVVQWDQPGGGATYARNMGKDVGPLTIARYRRDGIAVAGLVLGRLHKQKLVLYGVSWGTMLGVEMVQARPDLFSAYIGVSQTVGKRGEKLGYELAVKAAQERGDAKALASLEKAGPPPYRSFDDYLVRQTYTSPPGLPLKPAEEAAMARLAKGLTAPHDPNANYIAHGLPDYDGTKAFLSTVEQMFKEEGQWDAWSVGTKFPMPVMILNGEYDINTPASLAMEYCHDIVAPQKVCKVIPGAGHSTMPAGAIMALVKGELLPRLSRRQPAP